MKNEEQSPNERIDFRNISISNFIILNSEYAWSQLNASYVFLTLGEAKQSINDSLVGLGDFADFVPIIVIALAASIIIGLILIGFAFNRSQR